MALRPEIAMGAEPPQIKTYGPLDVYQEAIGLKTLLSQQATNDQMAKIREQEGRLNEVKIREANISADDLERASAGKRAYSTALGKAVRMDPATPGSFDIDDSVMASELKDYPEQLMAYMRNKADIKKEARAESTADLELRQKKGKALAQYFAPLVDPGMSPDLLPGNYSAAVKRARADKLVGDMTQGMPDQYDPSVMPYLQSVVQGAADDPWKAHLDAIK